MDTLTKLVEAISRSNTRINQLERAHSNGELSTGECIDLIEKETQRIHRQLERIKRNPEQENLYQGIIYN